MAPMLATKLSKQEAIGRKRLASQIGTDLVRQAKLVVTQHGRLALALPPVKT